MARFKNENGEELSLDDILNDSEYQAEFDKKISKALEKNKVDIDAQVKKQLDDAVKAREEELRKNIQDDMDAKAKEAEENAKLTEAEKFQKMIDQQNQKIAGYEKELAVSKREKAMKKYIKEKGYDAETILSFVDAESVTDNNYETKIDDINDKLNAKINAGVNARLADDGDKVLGKKGGKDDIAFDFNFQPIK